jgi:2,3-bisphosphoglycerate-independent phosphoglycerate mutase
MFEVLSKHPINLEREKNGLPTANIILMRGCG